MTRTQESQDRRGDEAKRNRAGELPDFSDYELMTKQRYFRAQLEPVAAWLRGRVFDVGANFGLFSALNSSTVSLDLEKRWLLRGMELGNINRPILGSALALPVRTECFDTVLALGIAEHIPPRSIPDFLDELTRVTKPGGRLLIRALSRYAVFSIRRIRMWSDYHHPYSPFRMRAQLLQRGWRQLAWMSSGLLGISHILPYTVNAPVPWAKSFIHVFVREEVANEPGGSSRWGEPETEKRS